MGLREDAPENTANESILVGEKVDKKKSLLSLEPSKKEGSDLH